MSEILYTVKRHVRRIPIFGLVARNIYHWMNSPAPLPESTEQARLADTQQQLMRKSAAVLGIPYPLDSYYLPLVKPSEVASNRLDVKPLFNVDQIFNLGDISAFSKTIAVNVDVDLLPYQQIAAFGLGLGFGDMEGRLYHAVVRSHKPKTIVEVGAGVSTWYAWHASQGTNCRIICVEPYPAPAFEDWAEKNKIELLKMPLQYALAAKAVPFEEQAILFVDSSHVIKTTNEGPDIFFKMLDQVKPGSLVHFHDIFTPYPTVHADHNMFAYTVNWNESIFLSLFIKLSREYQTIFPQYWLGRKHPEILEAAFAYYRETHMEGSSFWMRRI